MNTLLSSFPTLLRSIVAVALFTGCSFIDPVLATLSDEETSSFEEERLNKRRRPSSTDENSAKRPKTDEEAKATQTNIAGIFPPLSKEQAENGQYKKRVITQEEAPSLTAIMPTEILARIITFLSFTDQAKARQISKLFKILADDALARREIHWSSHLSIQTQSLCTRYFTTPDAVSPSIIPALRSMILEYKGFEVENFRFIAKKLRGTNIHTIDLNSNRMSDEEAIEFFKNLKDTNIHTVDLSWNDIHAQGVIELAQFLKNTHVHTLNLRYNYIEAKGAIGLAQQLKGTRIHTLDLSSNQIGDKGAIGLARHLKGTNVHTLDLSKNCVLDAGAIEFANNLKETKVRIVHLTSREIGVSPTGQAQLIANYPHIKWSFSHTIVSTPHAIPL